MKKIIITLLLLSSITACTVEDQSVEINDPNSLIDDVDCVIDPDNPPAVIGSTWARTSFIIATELDGNGDGIFTNDLDIETTCSADLLTFGTNFKAGNPTYHTVSMEVNDDGNGNLSQGIGCLIGDGLFPNYSQEGNIVSFCYSGELAFTATLSDDEQTLTFNFTYEEMFFPNNTILKQDGTVETLQGNVTIVYTRQ
ncbi:hypothetical protein [uncultured Kordia sp.]|uniref:hypothetical protein n=1 Tax=uncultured Kordia sp. TaxID=507699 RepID=UPI00261E5FFE|nr:hypothetical protein [uncultured Kordia sp.]